jgi:hypothetical protein
MHANPSSKCQSCVEKFLSCDPKIVSFVRKVQEVFPDCHVAVGYRDQADQHNAKLTGKSTLDWPNSKHNFTLYNHPYSKACDLFMLSDGQAHFLTSYYENIWNFYLTHKADFGSDKYRWGGSFSHLKDYDHFEIEG